MLIGIVGKPNCGKSTFFKALTLMNVEIANYPFATIKPNHGVGFVRVDCVCKEFGRQCNPREGFCAEGTRFVPVDVIDVAGLVPGAYEGKGMGNQFLDDLRQADVLVHVIDISGSTNDKGEPVEPGSYDPANDIRFLEQELDMWYLGIFKKVWDKFSKTISQQQQDPVKAIVKQFSGLGVNDVIVKNIFSGNKFPGKIMDWKDSDLKDFVAELRKATKPIIIAANKIDMPGAIENLKRIKEEFPDYFIIGTSAEVELALKEADKNNLIDYIPGSDSFKIIGQLSHSQEKAMDFIKAFLLEHKSTGVQDVLDIAVFNLLKYKAIYPGGVNKLEDSEGRVLPDVFLMPPETTALDFAYKLHSDFGNNFIKAIDVKTEMPIAKDHILKHRDVIEIMAKK
jgi:ribosome-binding ATPase YchF (GTP1/OBG family)